MSITRPETAGPLSAVAGTRWLASQANMAVRARGHDAGKRAGRKGRLPAARLEPHGPRLAGATRRGMPGHGVVR
jgi:hypothetical protein